MMLCVTVNCTHEYLRDVEAMIFQANKKASKYFLLYRRETEFAGDNYRILQIYHVLTMSAAVTQALMY